MFPAKVHTLVARATHSTAHRVDQAGLVCSARRRACTLSCELWHATAEDSQHNRRRCRRCISRGPSASTTWVTLSTGKQWAQRTVISRGQCPQRESHVPVKSGEERRVPLKCATSCCGQCGASQAFPNIVFSHWTPDRASLGSTSQVAAGHLVDQGCACDFGFDLKNIEGW